MGLTEKGNKIHIPGGQLTSTQITVKWMQTSVEMNQQYYAIPYYNKDQGDEQSIIFIQKDMLDQVRLKAGPGHDLTLHEDDSFQYGQGEDKSKRWILFHDKSNGVYQGRFVKGLVSRLGKSTFNFANGLFKTYGLNLEFTAFVLGTFLQDY